MKLHINDGDRPSRLELARQLVGEAPVQEPEAVEALRAEVEAHPPPAFDAEALRARAARIPASLGELPAPRAAANWGRWVGVFFAMAAALLLLVRPPELGNRLKGEDDLGFYVLREGSVHMGDPEATVRAGDRLQFSYYTDADRLILLSVDGTGRVSVFYPGNGEEGVEVIPGERHVLDGSVELDDAEGPEVFVAFFGDWTVREARSAAEEAWLEGGAGALRRLPARLDDVAVLALEKE